MVNNRWRGIALAALLPLCATAQEASSRWTLKQCIAYALEHNVQLRQKSAAESSAAVDVAEAKAARLPSLSGQVTQGLTYRPFQQTGGSFVNGGITTTAADKAMESGNYGVNAQWVAWNGGKTKLNIQNAELSQRKSVYDTQATANTIQEQIAQLYVQILYMTEAERVNRELLSQDSVLCERGREMVNVGSMAKADLAQLEAQVSQGRYDVVNTGTQIADAKMQLSQLLELPEGQSIDVEPVDVAEAQVLSAVPDKMSVYNAALTARPEVKDSELAVEQSKLATKIARTGYYPTVSLTGSLGDSHMTGGSTNFAQQMRNNFNAQLGVSLSIPIFDNRKTKSAVERAKVAETTAQLSLQDTRKTLYKTVETYWLNATNSQAKYLAARSNVESLETSYGLMSEQFSVGVKNIAELLTSRASLLNAKQQLIQDKYTALLNRELLDFYAGKSFE